MAMDNVEPIWCSQCGEPLPANATTCAICGATNVPPSQNGEGKDGAPAYHRLRVGDVLDSKWRLESKLGAGGMGSVFLAHDLSLDRKVAVKVLAGQHCSDDEFMLRFEREARMTAKLEHPNIVPVFAVGRHFGRPFIVMKALQGMTLAKLVAQRAAEAKRLSRDEVLSIFRQLLSGLGFIHTKGYVHRDIKAGNVFVSTDWVVTLLDFGVLRDTSQRSITRAGSLLGTPHYLSPEQALGMRNIDGRADLYSVGVLLYECLTLKPPFVGDAMTLMRAHAEAPPPDPTLIAPDLPKALGAVVQKVLSKKPAERYSTTADLYAAMEQAWPAQAAPGAPAPAALDSTWSIPGGLTPLSPLPPLASPAASPAPAPVQATAPAPAPAAASAPGASLPLPTFDLGLGSLAPTGAPPPPAIPFPSKSSPAAHPAAPAAAVSNALPGAATLPGLVVPAVSVLPGASALPGAATLPGLMPGATPAPAPQPGAPAATAAVKRADLAEEKPAPEHSIFTVPTAIGPAPTAPPNRDQERTLVGPAPTSRPSSPSSLSPSPSASAADSPFTAPTKVGPAPTAPVPSQASEGLGELTAPRDLRALAAAVEAGASHEPAKAPAPKLDPLAPAEPGAVASELLPSLPSEPLPAPDTAPSATSALVATAMASGQPAEGGVEDAFFDKQPEAASKPPTPAKPAQAGKKPPLLALGLGAGAVVAVVVVVAMIALSKPAATGTDGEPPKPVATKTPENPPPAADPKPADPDPVAALDPAKPTPPPDPTLEPLDPKKAEPKKPDPSIDLAGLDLAGDKQPPEEPKKPEPKKPVARPEPKKPTPVAKPEPRKPTPVTRPEPRKPEPVVAAKEPVKEPAKEPAKKMGKVRIATTLKGAPYWASVSIDGAAQGETPLTIELPAGKHKLHVERGGFKPVDKDIVVTAGKNPVVVGIELKP